MSSLNTFRSKDPNQSSCYTAQITCQIERSTRLDLWSSAAIFSYLQQTTASFTFQTLDSFLNLYSFPSFYSFLFSSSFYFFPFVSFFFFLNLFSSLFLFFSRLTLTANKVVTPWWTTWVSYGQENRELDELRTEGEVNPLHIRQILANKDQIMKLYICACPATEMAHISEISNEPVKKIN